MGGILEFVCDIRKYEMIIFIFVFEKNYFLFNYVLYQSHHSQNINIKNRYMLDTCKLTNGHKLALLINSKYKYN